MRLERTEIIALVNQKGGCGKTTSAVNLAAALATAGYSACLVDNDPQCNTTETFWATPEELAEIRPFTIIDIYGARRPAAELAFDFGARFPGKLGLVASSPGATSTEQRLAAELQLQLTEREHSDLDADEIRDEQRRRLANSLASLRGVYDFVIVDTPPELGFLMTSALIAADWYLIPVFPGRYDLRGLEALERTVGSVQRRYNPRLRLLGVVLGNFQAGVTIDRDIQTMLERKYDKFLFPIIHRSVKHREAIFYGKTIFEYPKAGQAAEQFAAAAAEIVSRIEAARADAKKAKAAAAGGGELLEVNRG